MVVVIMGEKDPRPGAGVTSALGTRCPGNLHTLALINPCWAVCRTPTLAALLA